MCGLGVSQYYVTTPHTTPLKIHIPLPQLSVVIHALIRGMETARLIGSNRDCGLYFYLLPLHSPSTRAPNYDGKLSPRRLLEFPPSPR